MSSMQSRNYRGDPDKVSDEILETHREAKDLFQDNYELYIGGNWIESKENESVQALDAITGEPIAEYTRGTEADVDFAVDAAEEAYQTEWSDYTSTERAELLNDIADELEEQKRKIATIDTLETGLPIAVSPAFVQQTVDAFRYMAGVAKSADLGSVPTTSNQDDLHHVYTKDEPYGVVGQIIPWNPPMAILGLKMPAALAAGNTIIMKPSPRGAISVLEFMNILDDILPPGTVNIVPGLGDDVGEAITSHRKIRKVSFTGSTEAGRSVMQSASSNIKPVSLELGGKSPNIVFPDADLETAAKGTAFGIFLSSGQVCTAGSRLFLHENIYDEFLEVLAKTTDQMFSMGDPLNDGTMLGPLIDHKHLDRVQSYMDQAIEEGADMYHGGNSPTTDGLGDAPFFEPTILTNVNNEDTVSCEEIFGPVLSVQKWQNRESMINKANDTEYGLAGTIWTNDLEKAHNVAEDIEAGIVWVNCSNAYDPGAPLGGFKQSGVGKELHKGSYHEYRRSKTVNMNLTGDWPRA